MLKLKKMEELVKTLNEGRKMKEIDAILIQVNNIDNNLSDMMRQVEEMDNEKDGEVDNE